MNFGCQVVRVQGPRNLQGGQGWASIGYDISRRSAG